jgi:alpha-L-arabinofuranosidase
MVFNKHHADAITATIQVADASAKSARTWTVTGPRLEATNLDAEEVSETVSGAAVPDVTPKGFTCTFPARSMTAIEIERQ